MFEKSREKHIDEENKLLIAKAIDKFEFCKTKNKITYTDFLNITEISILEKVLKEEHIQNYVFYGVKEDADRKILIFYPEKITKEMLEKNYSSILEIIRITLPNEVKYEHREFLSGIMKLGLKREKFGDIIVTDSGADIVVLKEVTKYFLDGLKELTRFRKSNITVQSINDIEQKETEFLDFTIIVSSIRLDNFVAELAKCSRTRAKEIIEQGNVFVNSVNELKDAKKLNIGDVITIRGKGKFIFENIGKETRSGRITINIKKYC